MSHFLGLIFGEDVNEILAPYDENLEVFPYIKYTKEEAIEEAKKRHITKYETAIQLLEDPSKLTEPQIKYYSKIIDKGIFLTYNDAWEEVKNWGYKLDSDENLLSTYNPMSKWDWYVEGGRWSGFLKLKDGSCSDFALVSEIDWDKTRIPFCFVDEENWYAESEIGWWCSTWNALENYDEIFKEYIKNLDPDTEVTVIDFHI